MDRSSFILHARGRVLTLGNITRVMGIVNVTPDSFSGDGQLKQNDYISSSVKKALGMVTNGADIIDIGGESTRPGAAVVTALEETRRVVPVIEALTAEQGSPLISVDTSKVAVAKEALKAGAHIVNIVRSNAVGPGMLRALLDYEAGVVLMHMRGTPKTMQHKLNYGNLCQDVLRELGVAVKKTLRAGVDRRCIIVDPGIGFSKSSGQNLLLIKELARFATLKLPILVGVSRKSFIGNILSLDPSERIFGTVAAVVASVLEGCHIVRVHDCQQIKQAVLVADAILSGGK